MAGDLEGTALELDSAEKVSKRNGARLYLDDCSRLRDELDTIQLPD